MQSATKNLLIKFLPLSADQQIIKKSDKRELKVAV